MENHFLVAISLVVFVIGDVSLAQRIRPGRCALYEKQANCPVYTWDRCSCDQDCPLNMKCCFTGCRNVCIFPDKAVTITTKADVLFVMDSSGSISKDDYKKEKEFVKQLANIFDISTNQARASVIIYDDNPKLIFGFEDELDNRNVSTVIQSLQHLKGHTRIDKALAVAEIVFTDARPTVPRIAFILTDGKQTADFDAKPLDVASKPLKDLGVKIYVIGIGGHVDLRELQLLVEKSEDVFTVDSFDNLLRKLKDIIQHADQPDSAKPVSVTADLLFLVDSSWSVTQEEFNKEKQLVNNLAKAFKVSPEYTRAGAIVYSNSAELKIPFGKHSNVESFSNDVNGISYIGGRKLIDNALQLASDTFGDARPQVPRIAVVLTRGNELTSLGSYSLENAIRSLRERNVHVFVVGVGDNLNMNTLENMVKDRKKVITERSFERLNHYAPSLARYIAKHTDISTPLDSSTDVVFLIDSSKNVGEENYRRLKEFVMALAKSFKPTKNGPRIGTVVFSRNAYTVNNLPDFTTYQDFAETLKKAGFLRRSRRIDKAIERSGEMFEIDIRGGPKIGILVSTGPSTVEHGSKTLNDAMKMMKQMGGKMYSIAVGPKIDENEILTISHPNDIIKMPDFRSLQASVQKIGLHISRTYGKQGQQTSRNYDVVFMIDSTSDVSSSDYQAQKEYIKFFLRFLTLTSDTTRAALIIYSNYGLVKYGFRDFLSQEKFEKDLENIEHLGGSRNFDNVLERAVKVFSDARPGSKKIAILLTAGLQQQRGAKALYDAARRLRSIGAQIYVIAIGNKVNINELQKAVQRSDDVIKVPSFDILRTAAQDSVNHVLGIKGAPKDFQADILFMIDSSKDISRFDFGHQKDYVTYIANLLNVMRSKSRAAVVKYGDKPVVVSHFDDFQSLEDLSKQVDRAKAVGGTRRMDNAFDIVPDIFKSARNHAPKVAIVLVGGKQDTVARRLGDVAEKVRNIGAHLFIVAVGHEVDYSELRPAVENQEDMFVVPLFGKLRHHVSGLIKHIAENSPKPKQFRGDVIFMMDSSNSISASDFLKQKNFVKSAAKVMNAFNGQTKVAVISYGSTPIQAIPFGSYKTSDEFHAAVDSIQLRGGSRRLELALDSALDELKSARPNVPKTVILVSGGKQDFVNQDVLNVTVKAIGRKGAKIIVMAIGLKHNDDQLRSFAQSAHDVFKVKNFDALQDRGLAIGRTIVSNIGAPPTFTSDVIFLVDTSKGVSLSDFLLQKSYIKRLARLLNVQTGLSRAALVTYSKNAKVVFSFNDYVSMEMFDEKVDDASFLGGTRRIDNALRLSARLLKQARIDTNKVVILFTAGQQAPDAKSVPFATKPLKDLGARMFIIAVDPQYDHRDLLTAVETSKDLTVIKTFRDLRYELPSLSRHIASETELCKIAADVAFVVDSSGSISSKDYETMKSFISAMARRLRLSSTGSRAGLIQYSTNAAKEIDLNDYISSDGFSKAVEALVQQRGQTRIDKALKLAYDEFFSNEGNARKNVQKIAFVLTDGRQTPDPDAVPLDLASEKLRRAGVHVIAVGIGRNVDKTELQLLTENDKDVYITASFEELLSKVGRFTKSTCKATQRPINMHADIVFVMDSSREVTERTFVGEKELTKQLARLLNVSPDKSRGAVATYGSIAKQIISFEEFQSITAFEDAIDNAIFIGGERRMDKALETAASMLARGEPSSPKIAVLMTTGNQGFGSDESKLSLGTSLLRDLGANIFVLAIGNIPSKRELLEIVRKPSEILSVTNFDDIINRALPISQEISHSGASPGFVANIIFLVDTSSDVTPSHFTSEQAFIKELSKHLNLRPGYSRASLVPYGKTADVGLRFESYTTSAEFESALNGLQPVGGRRSIDKALVTAAQLIPDGRPDVPTIVVLLIAGNQNVQVLPLSKKAMAPVANLGAHIYVIGIGPEKQFSIFKSSLNPGSFINIPSFSHLKENSPSIARQISSATPTCTVPVDLAVLMDSSALINSSDYAKMKSFVSSLVSSFGISKGGSRAAVILFSDFASIEIGFGQHENFDNFKKHVDGLFHQRGGNRIDRALQLAHSGLYGPNGSARRGVHRILVLLTVGEQTRGPDYLPLYKAASTLRKEGVYIFAVGIGSGVNKEQISTMVEKESDIFLASSFNDLLGKVGSFSKTSCEEPQSPTNADLDIVFAVDGSSAIRKSEYDNQKKFIKKIARSLNIAPGKSRGALVTYGNIPNRIFMFDEYDSQSQFNTKVDEARQQGGPRRLDKVFEEARKMFNSSRPGTPNLFVLLTGGGQKQGVGQDLAEISRHLYNMGTTTYIVNVGNDPGIKILQSMLENPKNTINVKSFDILPLMSSSIAREIVKGTCKFVYLTGDLL